MLHLRMFWGKMEMRFIMSGAAFLKTIIKKELNKLLSNLVTGEQIAKDGFGNFYPIFSKDGKESLLHLK